MAEVTIDVTGDGAIDLNVGVDEISLDNFQIAIADLRVLTTLEQLAALYTAVRPWFEDEADRPNPTRDR